jgi:ribonucleoside-diphosphate reductase beta chain
VQIKRDESRHIAYGVYLLSRLVAADASVWDVIEARMNELFPYTLGVVTETFERYENGVTPFGLEQETFVEYSSSQFAKRYERISRARGKTLEQIDALAEADA